MEIKYSRNSIVILNIPASIKRQVIKDKLKEFGNFKHFDLLPMKNRKMHMVFCRFSSNLSMLNAIKASNKLTIKNHKLIIRKAFEKMDLKKIPKLTITISNNGNPVTNNANPVSHIKSLDSTIITNTIQVIKKEINYIEASINTLSNQQFDKNKYRILIRLMELKDKYRNYLNFFSHEKITKFYLNNN